MWVIRLEEINIGAARANYGWPNAEGRAAIPPTPTPPSPTLPATRPLSWAGSSITGRSSRAATRSYFYADYAQHWIKRLTFDANGNVAPLQLRARRWIGRWALR